MVATITLQAQTPSTYVDGNGVLRWSSSKEEINLFGVNYTAPFAYGFKAIDRLGINHEEAIRQDVEHFAKLGINAFRIHVWDTEISDSLGNLINNEHLRLFDFLVKELKSRGIKMMLTPIAYWGNGYPEPDDKTPSFSTKYGKDACLINPEAKKAQANYLAQFLNHKNKYTGVAYKDDPDIVAFEISNEPHHPGDVKDTRNFINYLSKAMQKAGCKKPIFYNISHKPELIEAYLTADIKGGTFQWYPTGLVHNSELKGNQLPSVNKYNIPYTSNPKFSKLAKVVYEFDAGDVGRSYMYPYMAKSFREAGFQFATQFAYDPMAFAYANTEYQTHFLNLAYSPSKAISLMIAKEVFTHTPRTTKRSSYPADSSFGPFRVSYKQDLSEMVTDTTFLYTNNTASKPTNPQLLHKIAGVGTSPVVAYQGTGAYFLDKINDGSWRLEVMPDAVWVRDPFERNSLNKINAAIIWREHSLKITIPTLGNGFTVKAINNNNSFATTAKEGEFSVSPGVYILTKEGASNSLKGDEAWKGGKLSSFVAPKQNIEGIHVIHQPKQETTAGEAIEVSVNVYAASEPRSVKIYAQSWWNRPKGFEMKKSGAYSYAGTIPAEMATLGNLGYYIVVNTDKDTLTFPEGIATSPEKHDFYAQKSYNTRVVESSNPILLFDGRTNFADVIFNGKWDNIRQVPTASAIDDYLEVNIDNLKNEHNDVSWGLFVGSQINDRYNDLSKKSRLVLSAKSLNNKNTIVQIKLIDNEGNAYGKTITVTPVENDYRIDLSELKNVKATNLPTGYPDFTSYYFEGSNNKPFDIHRIEKLQFSIGPDVLKLDYPEKHGIAIRGVVLE